MGSHVLDEQDFHRCCQLLLQQSEQLKDGWSWEVIRDSEEGYLRKTALRSVVTDSSLMRDQEGSFSEMGCDQPGQEKDQSVVAGSADADSVEGHLVGDDEDDGACTVIEGSSQVLQYEYHIVYSCSYKTPVLYFRAFTLEGRSLSLEEVWGPFLPSFRLRLRESPLSTVSLQEHPLLGQPFFMLHPCRTEDFMRPMLQAVQDQQRPVNYVLSWLSVVGPLVGLNVPLKYSMQLHPAASLSSTKPD